MPSDFRYGEPIHITLPSLSSMMAVIKEQFQEWVRREIIDFDPYDDEGGLSNFPEELRIDK
ncbi:hypothetical protein [Acaryochloris marina]|nr:hypothetical protein [Acaryochloris marina]BDM79387.1 hypothetical protein AM10699_22550 [Acaryochloris marina MBIC10699]